MAQENIKLTKKIYDKQSASDLFNMSFSELGSSNNSVSNNNTNNRLNQLFILYNDLFYDIPKVGQQSHTTLFKQSRDYIGNFIDSKDEEIESLIDRIIELEQKLATAEQPDEEHPFYRNGTILVDREHDWWGIYYMDKGTRRKLTDNRSSDLFKDLKAALGYKEDDNWKDCVTFVSPSVITAIPPGPRFGSEDLGDSITDVEEELATFSDSFNYSVLQDSGLNPNNYSLTEINIPSWYNPTSYAPGSTNIRNQIEEAKVDNRNSYEKYREYLMNKIKIVWESEKRFTQLSSKYNNDIEFSFTPEESAKAAILKREADKILSRSREVLVYYKRLWAEVKSIPSHNNQLKDKFYLARANFENHVNTPATSAEKKEYSGWTTGIGHHGKENFPNIDL